MRRWILILAMVLCSANAYALDFAVQGGVGYSRAHESRNNGTWYQEGLPFHFQTDDIAWKAGLIAHHHGFFAELNYLSLGEVTLWSRYVYDHEYNHEHGYCMKRCNKPREISIVDSYAGPEIKVGYRWHLPHDMTIGVSTGTAILVHDFDALWKNRPWSFGQHPIGWSGVVPTIVGSGEACWKWVCGNLSYYHGLGETQNPLAKGWIVPMALVRVPF